MTTLAVGCLVGAIVAAFLAGVFSSGGLFAPIRETVAAFGFCALAVFLAVVVFLLGEGRPR